MLALKITDLTLAIPAGREETDEIISYSPTTWDRQLLGNLFDKLSNLETLSINTFAIPRCHDSAISRHRDPSVSFGHIAVPPSLKHFVIEEAENADCAGAETNASIIRRLGYPTEFYRTSLTLRDIQLNGTLETLHIKALRMDLGFIYVIDDCQDLHELRYDLLHSDLVKLHFWGLDMTGFFKHLERLHNLTVLDLRWPYLAELSARWPPRWTKSVPKVTILRVAFCWFAEALSGTDCNDSIHFELLFDMDEALKSCYQSTMQVFSSDLHAADGPLGKIAAAEQNAEDLNIQVSNVKLAIIRYNG